MQPIHRGRRLRATDGMRRLVRETRLSADALVLPLFVRDGEGLQTPIASLPGHFHHSPDRVGEIVGEAMRAGVRSFLLFGVPDHKDPEGSGAWAADGVVQRALRTLRRDHPDALLIADCCLCEYTDHGHCGVLDGHTVDNDRTLPLLAKTALAQAQAGADIVAPSDMMDGRVAAIRAALDQNGFANTPVMSYASKYASHFYGPFREAAGSAPAFGDRRGYQMDPHNAREAVREALADLDEGADLFIVKPALSYLDILRAVREAVPCPVAAYMVSGEYAMIKAAGAAGLIDERGILGETALSVFRAGADILITYAAVELAAMIRKGDIG